MNHLRLFLLILLMSGRTAMAADGDKVLAERARAAQTMSLQMMAADLLDELVYQWTQNPPIKDAKARVVLMRIDAPVGLNSQMNVFLENHLFNLLSKNPQSGINPIYCGPCLAVTSYSNNQRTIIGRGADIPEVAASLKDEADFALYVDIEALGSQLVLRAYIASLASNRILYARSIATDTGHPPLLRRAYQLMSAEDTRQEYVGILDGRKRISLLAGVRASIIQSQSDRIATAPFIWGVLGVETYANHRKKWLADLQLGVASLPNEYSAYQLSSRVYRHILTDTVDLTSPDLYVSAGFSYWEINGPGADVFINKKQLTPGDIISAEKKSDLKPKAHNIGVILGLETRIAEMIRLGLFIESFSNQTKNRNFKGSIHSYGFEFGVVL